jgi:formate dehydrogenase subunit delta
MNVHHLVTMANDICAFFQSEAGEQNAPKEIANHITRFWDPRMRAQIIEHAKAGGEGLSQASRAAVLLLTPPPPRN